MYMPFLEEFGRRKTQCVSTLFKLCQDTQDESLAFVGFARPIRGSFPSVSESAARYLAHVWSGHAPMLPDYERERIRQLDKLNRDLFFTAFDKFGYSKKCPETGGIARANNRAAGLTDLFMYADEMAKPSGLMPNYLRILHECGVSKWFIAILAPHHQGKVVGLPVYEALCKTFFFSSSLFLSLSLTHTHNTHTQGSICSTTLRCGLTCSIDTTTS